MKTASTIVLAIALMAGMAALASAPASAAPWCNICDQNGDCFSCCKCDGNSTYECAFLYCEAGEDCTPTEGNAAMCQEDDPMQEIMDVLNVNQMAAFTGPAVVAEQAVTIEQATTAEATR